MAKIGPFFYINGHLIFDAVPLDKGRKQVDKLDNSLGHDKLFDRYFLHGDYIDYPRGRVIWDCTGNQAVVYIDRCLKKENLISAIVSAFDLTSYRIEEDEHYRCPGCLNFQVFNLEL